jgi:DNA-directed RNA polymerase sigma subunit (sigma70/sigma32)
MQIPWSFQALGLERLAGKRALRRAVMLARGFPNPIAKARKYQAALAGGTRSYREVAEEFGVTREEVCQYMTLLRRLPAELVHAVETETRPEIMRTMSYRRLLAQARS